MICKTHDTAHVVSGSPPPLHRHPHLGTGNRSQEGKLKVGDRDLFAWRKVRLFHREGEVIPNKYVTKQVVQNIDVTSTISSQTTSLAKALATNLPPYSPKKMLLKSTIFSLMTT